MNKHSESSATLKHIVMEMEYEEHNDPLRFKFHNKPLALI